MKIVCLLGTFFLMTVMSQSASLPVTRIPIEYRNIHISFEMPTQWADSQFGFNRVPSDIEQKLRDSGDFAVCLKNLTWSRSFFRGSLGHMNVDVIIKRLPEQLTTQSSNHPTLEQLRIANAKADFRYPKDLYDYYKLSNVEGMVTSKNAISYVDISDVLWVRLNRVGNNWYSVPRGETLVLGLDSRTYLRIDLGVSREDKGPKGEAWQKAALYWQNKIIESIRVSGLKQILSGDEKVEIWNFPEGLEDAPAL